MRAPSPALVRVAGRAATAGLVGLAGLLLVVADGGVTPAAADDYPSKVERYVDNVPEEPPPLCVQVGEIVVSCTNVCVGAGSGTTLSSRLCPNIDD